MARVTVYLPDELAEAASAAGLDVSDVAREALRRELAARRTTTWRDTLAQLPRAGVSHAEVIEALDAVRAESGDGWPEPRDGAVGSEGAQHS